MSASRVWVPVASLALFASVFGAACSDGETTVATLTAEDRGGAHFLDPALGRVGNLVACDDCHESALDAPFLSGPPLGRVTDRPSYWGGQETDLLRAVNQCLFWFMGGPPLTSGDPVGDELYAYLDSLDGDDALAAAQPFTIGEVVWPGPGDAARGGVVYEDACAVCHGAKSTGDGALIPSAPVLPEETLTAHPDPEYSAEDRRLVFVEKVRHGPFLGYGGTMPPFSAEVISDADLAALFTYLEIP